MNNEIWQLLDSKHMGGIETHVLQLATGLSRQGHKTRVVFLDDHGEHPLKQQLREQGIPMQVLDGRFASLRRALRHHRPRLLHTHGYKAGLYGRLAARTTSIRSYSTYHAGEVGKGRLALYDWLDCHSAWLADGAFAVSLPIAQRIPSPSQVIDNFIDTTGLVRSEGQQIAFVGRLSREKGADRFLALATQYPRDSFHLYGDGPLAAELKATAPANVVFHGQQAQMCKVWPAIGLLVMPSRHEGLPMAALEAMARGVPVIASDVGALGGLITPNVDGWLLDQHDSIGFRDFVGLWLGMPKQQRDRIALAAMARVNQRYSSDAVIPWLLQHYQ